MSQKHDKQLTKEQSKALDRVMELTSDELAEWLFGKELATELERVAHGNESDRTKN